MEMFCYKEIMEICRPFGLEKTKPNIANFKCRIGRGLDSRFRGNDKYGIPARRKILIPFEKTKPISRGCK
jgi:hypothetical protein